MADITATTAWQSVGPLTVATTFQNKGQEAQVTAADPGGDLNQGLVLPPGRAHTFPEGTTVRYRSQIAGTRIAMEPAG